MGLALEGWVQDILHVLQMGQNKNLFQSINLFQLNTQCHDNSNEMHMLYDYPDILTQTLEYKGAINNVTAE